MRRYSGTLKGFFSGGTAISGWGTKSPTHGGGWGRGRVGLIGMTKEQHWPFDG